MRIPEHFLDIFPPENPAVGNIRTVQPSVFQDKPFIFRILHPASGIFIHFFRLAGSITDYPVFIQDLCFQQCRCKQRFITGIGTDQTALDAGFQKNHDKHAVYRNQIHPDDLKAVQNRKKNIGQQHKKRQFLKPPFPGSPAFKKQHHDKIQAEEQTPCHNKTVTNLIGINTSGISSLRERKYLLMKSIAEHKTDQKKSRKIKEPPLSRKTVCLFFSQILHQKNADQRDQDHRNVIGIPEILVLPAVFEKKHPFYSADIQPEDQKPPDRHQITADPVLYDTCVHRKDPAENQPGMYQMPAETQNGFSQRIVDPAFPFPGIIGIHQET